jgi:hypothetical protein
MRRLLAAAAALLLAAPAWAAATAPSGVTANYDMYRNGGHIAVMSEVFEAKDGAYHIASETRAIGLFSLFQRVPLTFTSSGRVTAAGLQPQRFEGKRGEADPRRVRGEFDWQASRLAITHDGRTDSLDLPEGTQDRLSFLYQFMFLSPGKTSGVEFSMTNGRKLGRYRYTVRAGVEIETPIGRLTTLHLVKQHRPDESGAEIWLSPLHRYLPVRMLVLEEDGTRYDQVITGIEIRP